MNTRMRTLISAGTSTAAACTLSLLASTAYAGVPDFTLSQAAVWSVGGNLPEQYVAMTASALPRGLSVAGTVGPISAELLQQSVGSMSFDLFVGGAINCTVESQTGLIAEIGITAVVTGGQVKFESAIAGARAYEPDGSGCFAVNGRYDGPAQTATPVQPVQMRFRSELFPDADAYGDWSAMVHITWTGATPQDVLTLHLPSGASAFSLAPAPSCPTDFNDDGATNTNDLVKMLGRFGTSVGAFNAGDVNGDGYIDTNDLVWLLARFGQSCQ